MVDRPSSSLGNHTVLWLDWSGVNGLGAMRTGMLWIRCQYLSGISLSLSSCVYVFTVPRSISIKSRTLICLHRSSTVYIYMKAVNQQLWWYIEIKGLPTESQEARFHYFVHNHLWMEVSSLAFILGRLRSTNVRVLWSVENYFLNERQQGQLKAFCIYSIFSSFPSVEGLIFTSLQVTTCLSVQYYFKHYIGPHCWKTYSEVKAPQWKLLNNK